MQYYPPSYPTRDIPAQQHHVPASHHHQQPRPVQQPQPVERGRSVKVDESRRTRSGMLRSPTPDVTSQGVTKEVRAQIREQEERHRRYYYSPSSVSFKHNGVVYAIKVVQHPKRARMCGLGDKDRRPINQVPIVQLTMKNEITHEEVDYSDPAIQASAFVVTAELWLPDGDASAAVIRSDSDQDHIARMVPSAPPVLRTNLYMKDRATALPVSDPSSVNPRGRAPNMGRQHGMYAQNPPPPMQGSWDAPPPAQTPFVAQATPYGVSPASQQARFAPSVQGYSHQLSTTAYNFHVNGSQSNTSPFQQSTASQVHSHSLTYSSTSAGPQTPFREQSVSSQYTQQSPYARSSTHSDRLPPLTNGRSRQNSNERLTHDSTPTLSQRSARTLPADRTTESDSDRDTNPNDVFVVRNLIGNTSVCGQLLEDLEGKAGIFFIFSDLSCRQDSWVRLHFSLFDTAMNFEAQMARLDSREDGVVCMPGLEPERQKGSVSLACPCLAKCFSQAFRVYQAKKFPGVDTSGPYNAHFAKQGAKISVRKEQSKAKVGQKRKAGGKPVREPGSDYDDDEDEEEEEVYEEDDNEGEE